MIHQRYRLRQAAGLATFITACAAAGPSPFPPPVPEVFAANETAGDPHRGRFSFEEAVAGLGGNGPLQAEIRTAAGAIHCRLRPDRSPIAVANFVGLARGVRPFFDSRRNSWITAAYYDGTTFHRSESGRFVQGGRRADTSSPGYRVQDEHAPGDAFDRGGVLAMANRDQPHTGAAEFFITTTAVRDLDGRYTIIGSCGEGWVVDEIAGAIERGERPLIESVEIHYGE